MPETKFDWPVIGHQKIAAFLQNSIKGDNLAHAYLFSGMEHLGKKYVVDCFILSLICTESGKVPCLKCQSCQQYIKGIHPDIILTGLLEDKGVITVEQIRELRKKLSLHAIAIKNKISIIEVAEAMNKEASNSLLKILEEPAGPTIHILISHEADSLFSTIKSRCQSIKFLPVAKKIIVKHLKNNFTESEAEEIASLSMGQPGLALRFSHDSEIKKHYSDESKAFLNLLNKNIAHRIKAISEYFGNEYNYSQLGKKALGLLNNWQRVTRDIILLKQENQKNVVNTDLIPEMEKISENITSIKALKIQQMIKEARVNIRLNVNPKLVIENFIINI